MSSTRQNGRRSTRQVWSVFIAVIYVQNIVLAQKFCTSDENCQFNEFCNQTEGNCNSCIDCLQYNRNETDIECPKNALQDCGGCLPGFAPTFKNHKDTDVIIGDEVCEAVDLVDVQSQPTDQSKVDSKTTTTTTEAAPTTPTTKTTITEVVTDDHVSHVQTMKVAGVQPHGVADQHNDSDSTSSTTLVTITMSAISDAQPTNQTGVEYDEFDAKRPWIYVGIAVTFFVLCGTCGVVGFKVYLLPKQLERKKELRKMRAIERAERNTRKTKEDTMRASKEEIQRLFSDQRQDSTPLILRSYLSKTARETSY